MFVNGLISTSLTKTIGDENNDKNELDYTLKYLNPLILLPDKSLDVLGRVITAQQGTNCVKALNPATIKHLLRNVITPY